jgi:hypothetical protein
MSEEGVERTPQEPTRYVQCSVSGCGASVEEVKDNALTSEMCIQIWTIKNTGIPEPIKPRRGPEEASRGRRGAGGREA